MKSCLLVICLSFAFASSAAPNFVTPNMMKRNGLTDEQYQFFWKLGKNPHVDLATARDWYFRSRRYENVTNWLEVIGKTNDFARLVVPTMATNEMLVATNRSIRAINKQLERHVEYLTNEVAVVEAKLAEAEAEANVTKELRKAAKRTEKNLKKVLKTLEQAKKKATDEDEVELYSALIAILEGKDPN